MKLVNMLLHTRRRQMLNRILVLLATFLFKIIVFIKECESWHLKNCLPKNSTQYWKRNLPMNFHQTFIHAPFACFPVLVWCYLISQNLADLNLFLWNSNSALSRRSFLSHISFFFFVYFFMFLFFCCLFVCLFVFLLRF